MIYLGEQYIYHNGIMVLPDYSNPHQFYYLSPPPRLVEDPGIGKKMFKLIKLVGGLTDPIDEDGVLRTGVTFFDCDLRLTEAEQEELKDAVQTQLGIAEEINLAPLLYKDGEVVCYVLGEQDWDDNVADGTSSNVFVEQLAGFGKPSLYGDNRATFSARLTREGATALEASFSGGGIIGISVVYTLKFDALRPAFNFKVTAQWEQIYHFLKEKCGVDLWFYTNEETSIVEELEQNQLISFEEVLVDPAASGEIKQLRKQLQQYILDKFFKPVLVVGEPAHGKVSGLVHDILRAIIDIVPAVGYQRVELTQEERKFLSFEVTQISAVERVIYPQAHLTTLIPAAELPDYIQEINTDTDLFFRQLNVECVLGGCDFTKQKIAWVQPYIRYGDAPEEGTDKTLENMDDRMSFTAWLQPNHGFKYRTWYNVVFEAPDTTDPETIFGKDLEMSSPEEERTDRTLAINPMQLFVLRDIEFALREGFPTDEVPSVEVQLKHEDSDGYHCEKTYILKNPDKRNCRFRIRMRRGTTAMTQYRLTYHRAAGSPILREWDVVDGSFVLVDHPFPNRLTVSVRIADNPDDIQWADVWLKYEDVDYPESYREECFSFTSGDLVNKRLWMVRTPNPKKQRYQYRFTICYQDGTTLESPSWIESEARTLTVGRLARLYRTVVVMPDGPSFSDEGLRDIKVTLVHQEPDEPEPQTTELLFKKEDESQTFTYQVRNPIYIGYEYEIRYCWLNGRVKKVQGTAEAGALNLTISTQVD